MMELPVKQGDGSVLLAYERLQDEGKLGDLDPVVPLTASLVVVWWGDRCLMVFNRHREAWELPGGMLDPGESPHQAARRELDEESGQRPSVLQLAGVARVGVPLDGRVEFLAIYRARIVTPLPFTANDEMSDLTWWDPTDDLPDLLPIDAAIARLCLVVR